MINGHSDTQKDKMIVSRFVKDVKDSILDFMGLLFKIEDLQFRLACQVELVDLYQTLLKIEHMPFFIVPEYWNQVINKYKLIYTNI